ncbi:MAG TPA: thioredoxin family protein [Gaiellaceae bacterium]|nr:thioredoxin family protein [Gaiellaceae bacterium]
MTQTAEKPTLLFFYSHTSGESRRVERLLAQVLQRRRNHDTFVLRRIDTSDRPDIAERFRVDGKPVLCVVEHKRVVRRLVDPRSARDIADGLEPWLRAGLRS